ncbi:hypothetical protein AEAC466_05275 [Asticcacaulis sp. AC466]|uniref:glycoside hydrolase family 36 protein n=1 Tax=Asticcacaulis sp. AC466 TaxID=1282362 RepID=UPI0003C405BF|nr:glycoside hydrolase family 36 protein [Asticcacaulis sp. AC466]ESQ85123.1 hypothetical protein AEAC466_05275 [Asticcacaulis sp. AC466]
MTSQSSTSLKPATALHRRGLLKLFSGTMIASGLMPLPVFAQSASIATVSDDVLSIDFDLGLNSRVSIDPTGNRLGLTEFAPSETVTRSDGRVIDRFSFSEKTQRKIRDEHGDGTVFVIRGTSAEGLEKVVKIRLYDRFPGFALTRVTYRNTQATPVAITRWTSHAHTLKGAAFWSFSGSSHDDRRDWVQPVKAGFDQPNFMGMNASDYGGGTPIVDVWRPDAGLAVGHIELTPKLISLPLVATPAGAGVAICRDCPVTLAQGDELATLDTFISVHRRDHFATLDTYRRVMADRGLAAPKPPAASYEPVWCAWGYQRNFTVEEIEGTLAKAKAVGLSWAVLDDGWQTSEGDWYLDTKKFPRKDADMVAFVQSIKKAGLKPRLWLAPLAVDPGTDLLHDHTDMLLLDQNGAVQNVTWWNAFYLCPAYRPTQDYYRQLVRKIIGEWGFEGLKLDGQHMNGVAPCYNPAHNHAHPEESVEQLQTFWKLIYDAAREVNPDAVVEFCPCGTSYAFHNLPYTNHVPASDPLSSWQVRLKGKSLKALMGGAAAYAGDHVELSDGGDDFASTVGIGGIVSTKFAWPGPGHEKGENYQLTPEREALWRKWIAIYNTKQLAQGQYRGELYDIGFDKPEAHAVEKDGKLYYAFYAPKWEGPVELRGLTKGRYRLVDYYNDIGLGEVTPAKNRLAVRFDRFLLIEAIPV